MLGKQRHVYKCVIVYSRYVNFFFINQVVNNKEFLKCLVALVVRHFKTWLGCVVPLIE